MENIKVIGKLIEVNNGSHRVLTGQKRLDFAYQYGQFTTSDITDLCNYAFDHSDIARSIILVKFVNTQKFSKYPSISPESLKNLSADVFHRQMANIKKQEYWLKLYDEEQHHYDDFNRKFPIQYSYIRKDGSTLKVDKSVANTIIGILAENDIPLIDCLVKGGFQAYANETIDDYMSELKQNDNKIKRLMVKH